MAFPNFQISKFPNFQIEYNGTLQHEPQPQSVEAEEQRQ